MEALKLPNHCGKTLVIVLVSLIGGLITTSRYASKLCGVSLPQDDNFICKLVFRDTSHNKVVYTLKHDEDHGFALLNMGPLELSAVALTDPFISHYMTQYLLTVTESQATHDIYSLAYLKKEIKEIAEYLLLGEIYHVQTVVHWPYTKLPSKFDPFNSSKSEWISDKLFTQQRLAGTNPMSIKRVTIHGEEQVGLDWKKLKELLSPAFDWDAAVQAALKTEDSLEEAIKQGRIYALRYELCDDMKKAKDKTDSDPRRVMWEFLSPIALFASVNGGQHNELVPIAIQMDYKPGSAVYSPKDGHNWMIAKLNVQITDLGYSQMVEHLDKVHYFMEPFCVCLKRTLPPLHPLNQILKYHCREVIIPNTLGTPALTSKVGFVSKLFAFGAEGAHRLVRDGHKLSTWEVTDFRNNIKKRGLGDKSLLPYFPYRDDGEQILKVIEDMVKDYVDLYYKRESDITGDWELQAYLNEVSSDGTGENGGIGKIQGLPASINTKKELCDFLSRMISHLTIQHAAVNYELVDYASHIPNIPTKMYNDTRVEEGEFSVYRLPNRNTSSLQASFTNSLATFRYDTLYDYGNELWDKKAKEVVNRYHSHLMEVVQRDLEAENRKRLYNGDLTYLYLLPKWLPNGIQT
ncbi:polyunsaturated fatty acid 5-lipoxygenase-like isoform X2 [Oculina patagonica]